MQDNTSREQFIAELDKEIEAAGDVIITVEMVTNAGYLDPSYLYGKEGLKEAGEKLVKFLKELREEQVQALETA